jgi:hypothetical protein
MTLKYLAHLATVELAMNTAVSAIGLSLASKKESRSDRRTIARPYSDFCDYCSLLFDCAECKRSKMTHFSHDYEQGIKDERERIIKYLEEHKHLRYPNIQVKALFEELNWFMTEGENND